jgi:hypothetical protein
VNRRRALRGILMVTSIGLALHLVLPEMPGLERALQLISGTSHLLVGAAFVAEVLGELCYAELLGRSVGKVSGLGFSSRLKRCRRIERWFMLRLKAVRSGDQYLELLAQQISSGSRETRQCASSETPAVARDGPRQ